MAGEDSQWTLVGLTSRGRGIRPGSEPHGSPGSLCQLTIGARRTRDGQSDFVPPRAPRETDSRLFTQTRFSSSRTKGSHWSGLKSLTRSTEPRHHDVRGQTGRRRLTGALNLYDAPGDSSPATFSVIPLGSGASNATVQRRAAQWTVRCKRVVRQPLSRVHRTSAPLSVCRTGSECTPPRSRQAASPYPARSARRNHHRGSPPCPST